MTTRQGKVETLPIYSEGSNWEAGSLAWSNGGSSAPGSGLQPPRSGNRPPYSAGDHPGNRGRRGRRPLITALIATILLIVTITSAGYAYFNQGRTAQGATGKITQGTTITPGVTHTSTPKPTATPRPTNTPALTIAPTLTSTPTTTPVPFSVTGVKVSVNPSNFNGACTDTMTFTFTATISVPAGTPGGTVTYTWLRSDSATSPTNTASFNPGDTNQTVTTTWQLGAVWGNGSTFWEALQITSPNSVSSAHSNFSFVCQFAVSGINASVSPTTYDCSQSQVTFNFSATLNVIPGPNGGNITYTWARSDGATISAVTIAVPAGQTTVTVTDTWTLGSGAPAGSYWEQVVVTSPGSVTSNQATFTKSC